MIYDDHIPRPLGFHFAFGDRVQKKRGSNWHGLVAGFYSTTLTPEGYDVESEREPGSVQLYPYEALERIGA
jgi:dihydrofolate reductase (trimethoprim resistance protein)